MNRRQARKIYFGVIATERLAWRRCTVDTAVSLLYGENKPRKMRKINQAVDDMIAGKLSWQQSDRTIIG